MEVECIKVEIGRLKMVVMRHLIGRFGIGNSTLGLTFDEDPFPSAEAKGDRQDSPEEGEEEETSQDEEGDSDCVSDESSDFVSMYKELNLEAKVWLVMCGLVTKALTLNTGSPPPHNHKVTPFKAQRKATGKDGGAGSVSPQGVEEV